MTPDLYTKNKMHKCLKQEKEEKTCLGPKLFACLLTLKLRGLFFSGGSERTGRFLLGGSRDGIRGMFAEQNVVSVHTAWEPEFTCQNQAFSYLTSKWPRRWVCSDWAHSSERRGGDTCSNTGSFMETCWRGSDWRLAHVLKTTAIKTCSNRRFLNHYTLSHAVFFIK